MTAAGDLHQRGLAAASVGRFEEAVALLAQAVAASPGERAVLTNLGLALSRLGRNAEAVEAYRAALALDPRHAGTLAKLGRVLAQSGQFHEAIDSLERACSLDPRNPDTANALGAALAASGEEHAVATARAAFRRAVELDPEFGEAWRNLGLLEARQERWTDAAAALGRAVQLEPPDADLFYQHGVSLGRTGRHQEAGATYERAVALAPRFAAGWNNLAHERAALGDPASALTAVEEALRIEPHYTEARYNLGVTLQSLGRDTEARTAYQLVLASSGPHADALNNLGGLCLSEADPLRAAELYERALEVNSSHPEARWNLGLAQLSLGRWRTGWKNYEARRGRTLVSRIPRWRRGEDLTGRSVILWCEQGLGDGIQFLRYASEVRKLGARHITVECPGRLAPLFRLADGLDAVVERGSPLPAADFQVSLMSLPYEFDTQEETMPAPGPSYCLPEEQRAAWRRRLDECGPGLKVGIVWGGNPDNPKGLSRSMPLAELAAIARPGVTAISLQHGPQVADLAAFPRVLSWPPKDLVDTAALVSELDLVITVDTLMAHLAGTLARRVWVLLPFAADWRWMTAPREDSPWYPARMRLFRQTTPGDWRGLVRDQLNPALPAIVSDLDALLGEERGAVPALAPVV
jgi:tetratricopeptide (TPR) repeat protein